MKEMLATQLKIVMLLLGGFLTTHVFASDNVVSIEDIWKKYRELPAQESINRGSININGTKKNLSNNDEMNTEQTIVENGLGISGDISKVRSIFKEKNKPTQAHCLFRQAFS